MARYAHVFESAMSVKFVRVTTESLRMLADVVGDAAVTLDRGYLSARVKSSYREAVNSGSLLGLRYAADELRARSATAPGAMVIRCGPAVFNVHPHVRVALCTALCTLVGHPFRVFDRWELWRPLGVDLGVSPSRATGVGYIPFHIDIVNSERPPDYVAFFCERADPLGGGQTIVSNLLAAYARLSPEDRRVMSEAVFREGRFHDLSSVGRELNPFPVFAQEHGSTRVRFTAKMLPAMPAGAQKTALSRYLQLLEDARTMVPLIEGDLLIINQWVAAHGRLPLGDAQGGILEAERRLILQAFVAADD